MTETVFTRALIALPSPPAGEGGPQGQMRRLWIEIENKNGT